MIKLLCIDCILSLAIEKKNPEIISILNSE